MVGQCANTEMLSPSKHNAKYLVEGTLGHQEQDTQQERKSLFFGINHCSLGEMAVRFIEWNHKYMDILEALDLGSGNFLNPQK